MHQAFELVKLIAGSAAGSAVITAALIWFVFWVFGKFVKMTTKHEGFEKSCADLNTRVEKLEGTVHEIKGDMQFVKSTLNNIVNMLQTAQKPVIQAHSPLSLTEFGLKMAADMGADAILSRCFSTIKARIDADVIAKTPYDVQTYCLEKIPVFPETYLDAEAIAAIKKYAFDNGRTLFECLKVIGIKARDAYFKATGIS